MEWELVGSSDGEEITVQALLELDPAAGDVSTITIAYPGFDAGSAPVHEGAGLGIAGRTVYIDTDGNGLRDSSEPTATTDDRGWYAFKPLPAGDYELRLDTEAEDDLQVPSGGVHALTLASGERRTGLGFTLGGGGGTARAIEVMIDPGQAVDFTITPIPVSGSPSQSPLIGGVRFEGLDPASDHRIEIESPPEGGG